MGNNAAFSSFEASVIAVYNKGVLDKELLDALASAYEGTDIDRGGFAGTLAKDGLDVDDIILKLYGVTLPAKPKLPADNNKWTRAQKLKDEAWWELHWSELSKIEDGWGWH